MSQAYTNKWELAYMLTMITQRHINDTWYFKIYIINIICKTVTTILHSFTLPSHTTNKCNLLNNIICGLEDIYRLGMIFLFLSKEHIKTATEPLQEQGKNTARIFEYF